MKSKISAVIDFNKREELGSKIGQYILLILLLIWVISEFKAILTPNEIYIGKVEASTGGEIEHLVKTGVVAIPASQPISDVIKTTAEVKSVESNLGDDGIVAIVKETFGDQADNALRIMECESQNNPLAIGDRQLPKPSYGLFQVNVYYNPKYSAEKLLEAKYNILAAKELYDQGGWRLWTCGRNI